MQETKYRNKGLVDITIISTLIMFLGTGFYNMYKIRTDTKKLNNQNAKLIKLQEKYCNVDNPTLEQLKICKDLLEITAN